MCGYTHKQKKNNNKFTGFTHAFQKMDLGYDKITIRIDFGVYASHFLNNKQSILSQNLLNSPHQITFM